MKNYNHQNKFEFLLYINGKIIVQRYFNVKDFNEESLDSYELYEIGKNSTNTIKKNLERKTREYLWGRYNPYSTITEDVINIYDKEDIFGFEIKYNDRMLYKEEFSGNVYPPKVRYSVDIRPIIAELISDIENGFSLDEYSKIADVYQ